MRKFLLYIFSLIIFFNNLANAEESLYMANDPENSIQIELKDGNVIIELLHEVAPNHVNQIKELAREVFMMAYLFIELFQVSWHRQEMGNLEMEQVDQVNLT